MGNILLSQTSAFATVVTAIVALLIYWKTKRDELENAVRIIVLEIKESERAIRGLIDIKNSGAISYPDDLIKITPLKGWSRYSHLFIKKLNNDEYDQLNEYFKKCEVLERYIEKNHNFFWITTEERAKQKEKLGAKIAYQNSGWDAGQITAEVERIASLYFANSGYSPAGIKTQMDRNLNSITLITTTPVWNRLKKLAQYKDLLG